MLKNKERVISIELKSRSDLKNLAISNGNSDSVLLEASIGELITATFTEGIILEVIGINGVLRVDLEENEIKKKTQQPIEAKQP